MVEGYPQDTRGKKTSATFLYNTTRSLYEQTGFNYDQPEGKNDCVMRRRFDLSQRLDQLAAREAGDFGAQGTFPHTRAAQRGLVT